MSITRTYTRPPINELAISVSLSEPRLFNPFNVSEFHQLVASGFPIVERVDPTNGLDFEQFAGLVPLAADQRVSRWWFVSNDQANILQAQENFISRNWRRVVEINEPPAYPGFEAVSANFLDIIEKVKSWHISKNSKLPDPRSVELSYDNVMQIPQDGSTFMLADTLAYLKRPVDAVFSMANWQNAWLEPIEVPGMDTTGTLSIQIVIAGMPSEDEGVVKPVLRMVWKAAMLMKRWDDVPTFMEASHAHISKRFDRLLTDKCKELWG